MAAVESDNEDRISGLPINVIHRILELLPIHDAARTSSLSKKWKYIWPTVPSLVLDRCSRNKLMAVSHSDFIEIVDTILLQHVGVVAKFVLVVIIGPLLSTSNRHIDRWTLYVTKNGVKQLTLDMSKNSTTYKLPSHIFNCPTLTHLKLHNCVFKPPNSFLGFTNLKGLYLERIIFVPTTELCVIKAVLLVNLTLKYCSGTQYVNIISSRLNYLYVREFKHYHLDLNCFMNCQNLRELTLDLYKQADCPKHDVKLTLEKLLFSLTILKVLSLDLAFLELLSAGAVSKGLPFTFNCLCHLKLVIDFGKVGQTSYALELIKSSSNLSKLEIWVQSSISDNAEAATSYLDSPSCLDRPLNKLKHVFMHLFRSSKSEVLFLKLLCAHTPSLVRMPISSMERNITTEIMSFPRASPKAELFYFPNVD